MRNKRRIRMNKTQNAIEKRKRIIKNIWNNPEHPQYLQEGRLRKYNFTCDCGCCRRDKLDEKYHPKAKYLWYYRNYDMDKRIWLGSSMAEQFLHTEEVESSSLSSATIIK